MGFLQDLEDFMRPTPESMANFQSIFAYYKMLQEQERAALEQKEAEKKETLQMQEQSDILIDLMRPAIAEKYDVEGISPENIPFMLDMLGMSGVDPFQAVGPGDAPQEPEEAFDPAQLQELLTLMMLGGDVGGMKEMLGPDYLSEMRFTEGVDPAILEEYLRPTQEPRQVGAGGATFVDPVTGETTVIPPVSPPQAPRPSPFQRYSFGDRVYTFDPNTGISYEAPLSPGMPGYAAPTDPLAPAGGYTDYSDILEELQAINLGAVPPLPPDEPEAPTWAQLPREDRATYWARAGGSVDEEGQWVPAAGDTRTQTQDRAILEYMRDKQLGPEVSGEVTEQYPSAEYDTWVSERARQGYDALIAQYQSGVPVEEILGGLSDDYEAGRITPDEYSELAPRLVAYLNRQ